MKDTHLFFVPTFKSEGVHLFYLTSSLILDEWNKFYELLHLERIIIVTKMKFMKLGNRPDTFITEEATRSVISDVPSDLTIQINNISYLLHKLQYPLLPKCGLLQQLTSDSEDSSNVTLNLHDIPGGEEAFELCAKYCYGMTINLSAHNFVSAFCAAKYLGMTEKVETGNFVMKLEVFLSSCILEGWKDSVVTLQNTRRIYEWSESLGIIQKCVESIVDKILTPPHKVSWSYTYTRPGYQKNRRESVPKDWWTEDISFLDVDLFRCIVMAIKSTNMLQPQLIGEALHVYACQWLPDITNTGLSEGSTSQVEDQDSSDRKQRILQNIVSLVPADKGSFSVKFLLRLVSISNFLGVSQVTKAELLRLSGSQLEDAALDDLLLPNRVTSDQTSYDIELVQTVLESFLRQWKRQTPTDESLSLRSINNVGKLIDSYLQVVSKDAHLSVKKMTSLAETLPGIARTDHDNLYKAINIYLKEHPDLSKMDKKHLCRILDCQKLSPEVRSHAVKNDQLPLRTVVQLLFFEQEKGLEQERGNTTTNIKDRSSDQTSVVRDDMNKLKLSTNNHHSSKGKGGRNYDDKFQLRPELSFKIRESAVQEMRKGRKIRDEGISEIQHSNLNPQEKAKEIRISGKNHSNKGRER
ncbi:BTB/POZ domain-containing protein At5g47800-like isoform X4 [Primulina huaijiensis]|uniref:BTB/POZ domain-containing protein At5g47800-like isoform X4 n=1 Tax=Primulina huaijiensis TaxID=1492673 RepID=UPI003CC78210